MPNQKLGLLKKFPKNKEASIVYKAYQNLSHAYANMFLPTLVFDREATKRLIRKGYRNLEKVV